MSKVESYKCDICGEVYHVDHENHSFVIIHTGSANIDESSTKSFEHICPECCKNVNTYIDNPNIVHETNQKLYNETRARQKLEGCISKIGHKFWHIRSFWYGECDCKFYDDYTQDIIREIIAQEKASYKWKRIAKIFIALSIGLFIGNILGNVIF
jgi:hypothetical protein